MSPRLAAFHSLATCPVRRGLVRKLSLAERALCEQFIAENESLSSSEFAFKLNRWFLDKPDRPRHLNEMWAALTESNSIAKGDDRG